MKFPKTILTLLAALLAVIGATTTVAHADEPIADGDGDATQASDVLLPEDILSGDDLDHYRALTTDAREYLQSEALPQLLGEVLDADEEPTRADMEFLTITLVGLFKEGHDALEAQRQLIMSSVDPGAADFPASPCSYSTALFSYNRKAAAAHYSRCAAQMDSISAGVWLKGPVFHSRRHYVRHDAAAAFIYLSSTLVPGCWLGWGEGEAAAEKDGLNPSPASGSTQLQECY